MKYFIEHKNKQKQNNFTNKNYLSLTVVPILTLSFCSDFYQKSFGWNGLYKIID